ncbi:MAG TPA: hypothetical protein VGM90_33645 [Kofleriaceae bacterium]|jgi:hypothetical protein
MRALVGCVVALTACGGAQVAKPAWQAPYSSYLVGGNEYHPDGSQTDIPGFNGSDAPFYVGIHGDGDDLTLDALAPSSHEVLARIEHATREHIFGAQFIAIKTRDPKTKQEQWRVASFKPGKDHTELDAYSPPMRGLHKWTDGNNGYVLGVLAGTEEEVYVPLDPTGRPVWMPPGTIGVKPVLYNKHGYDLEWRGWLVQWSGQQTGVTFSSSRTLGSLDANGPAWKVARAETTRTKYGEWFVVYGTRLDGTCETTGSRDDGWAIESGSSSTCDSALAESVAKEDAFNAELEEKRKVDEAAARARQAQHEANEQALERNWHAYIDAIYASGSYPTTFPPDVCTVARTFSGENHASILNYRSYNAMLPHELECFVERTDVTESQKDEVLGIVKAVQGRRVSDDRAAAERVQREEHQRRAEAATPAYSGTPDDHGLSDETRAIENQNRAMEAYARGGGGVCPFSDRSLCN